jgi:hypothetical protein
MLISFDRSVGVRIVYSSMNWTPIRTQQMHTCDLNGWHVSFSYQNGSGPSRALIGSRHLNNANICLFLVMEQEMLRGWNAGVRFAYRASDLGGRDSGTICVIDRTLCGTRL